jgi:hypothetical protein
MAQVIFVGLPESYFENVMTINSIFKLYVFDEVFFYFRKKNSNKSLLLCLSVLSMKIVHAAEVDVSVLLSCRWCYLLFLDFVLKIIEWWQLNL